MNQLLTLLLSTASQWFTQAELYATQGKDLFMMQYGLNSFPSPFYNVLECFQSMFWVHKQNLFNYCPHANIPANNTLNQNHGAMQGNIRPFVSTAFAAKVEEMFNICDAYISYADHIKYPFFQPIYNSQFQTFPCNPTEAQPAGANVQLPYGFDQDKWIAATAAAADDIYNNWETMFRTLEVGFVFIALVEKFLCHEQPDTKAKVPRFYHRAVATRDTQRSYQPPALVVPSRSVSGLTDPHNIAANLKPAANVTGPRVLKVTPLACPARLPFWMPRMRSLILDRSGYDARLRKWMTAAERTAQFTLPQDRAPQPTDRANGGHDIAPKKLDISDRARNCDDLRVNASTTTIWGSSYDFSVQVPQVAVNGARAILGNNAYLTPDCAQRKSLDFKLPVNPFAAAHITSGS